MPPPPLSIAFVAPPELAIVKGIVYVNAATTGKVINVQLTIDGAPVGQPLTRQPYGWCWDTRNVQNGSHTLALTAVGQLGQIASATRHVIVNQVIAPPPPDTVPPQVAITSPTNGQTVSGTVTLQARATDNVAVASVQFYANGVSIGTVTGAGPLLTLSWPTGANGQVILTALATDTAGNTAISAQVRVTVQQVVIDVTPPTVSLTAPANNATVTGLTIIAANAADNVGVASVQFFVNGAPLGVSVRLPYQIGWVTSLTPNGAATLTAIATDLAGNQTTSAARTVTVSNPVVPAVAITSPIAAAVVSGTVLITTATIPTVVQVVFKVNGTAIGTVTKAPFQFNWLTGANGAYTLTAVATDTAGNVVTSAPISVTVTQVVINPTPPTVSITSPLAGATVSGTVLLQATAAATLPATIAGVTFKAGGVLIGTVTTAPYQFPWVTPASGTVVLTAVATDTAGNSTTSAGVSVTVHQPDTTPPTVSLTAPSNGSTVHGTVVVSATAADNVGVAQVEFFVNSVSLGVVLGAGPYSVNWPTGVNGVYVLTAKATDTSGNSTVSSPFSITVTQLPPPDTIPPVVSMTAPANGAVVSGTVVLGANATDNVAVASVQFRVNGNAIGTVSGAGPAFSLNWVTGVNGAYVLTARATDTSGNTTISAPVNVTVQQPDVTPPTVSVTSPANNATVAGTVVLIATAADPDGSIASVRFRVNGVVIGTVTVAPYQFNWVTGPNGAAVIDAQAVDDAGLVGTSAPVNVTVNNIILPPPDTTPPTVTITAPGNGVTLQASTTLAATASDVDSPVVGVQFKVNGANLGAEVLTPPYTRFWDITGLPLGAYTFTAVGRDPSGNVGTSAAVTITLVAPPPPPPPGTKTVLTSADFTWLGFLRMPDVSTTVTDWAAAGLTGRMVNGVVHLFVFSAYGNILEIVDPGSYGKDYTTAPKAALSTDWGNIRGGKDVSWNPDGSPHAFDAYNVGGMYWHEGLQRLYWTFYDSYNIPGIPDWNLGFSTLDNPGTGAFTAYGPFRTTAMTSQGLQYGAFNCMSLWMNPLDNTLMCGATIQSGDTHVPYGPSAFSGLNWPGPSTPAGFSAPDLNLPDRYLMYYSMAGQIGLNGNAGSNPITSLRRPYKPYVFDQFAGDSAFPQVNPAIYNGVGSWCQIDYFRGGIWLELTNRHGFLAAASVAGSTIQDPNNCGAAHTWYSNGGVGHLNCPHGCAPTGGYTGPVLTVFLPLIYIFDPADLLAVKAGTKVDYTVDPAGLVDLSVVVGPNAPTGGSTSSLFTEAGFSINALSGFYFDPVRKYLFAAACGADYNGHLSPWTIVHVFAVNDSP